MNTEDLIKDAFRSQAERETSEARVLANLPAVRNRYRTKVRLTTAAVAVLGVVAAVIIPTVAFSGRNNSHPPAVTTIQPAPNSLQLNYRPTWLPDGVTEHERTVGDFGWDFSEIRKWKNGVPSQESGHVSVTVGVMPSALPADPQETAVDINGIPGKIVVTNNTYRVRWSPQVDTNLFTYFTADKASQDAEAAALRIARSVAAETTARLQPAMEFGWLPEDIKAKSSSIEADSPQKWSAELQAAGLKITAHRAVIARLGPIKSETSEGATVTVHGRPTRFIAPGPHGGSKLEVDLGEGRWLNLTTISAFDVTTLEQYHFSESELVKIAESIKLLNPDTSWIGKR